jgi:Na+-driven multidrug efflux pump
LTTFVSQNLGAGNYERVKKGTKIGSAISIGCAELIGVSVFILSPLMLRMFSQEAEVIAVGGRQARTESLFYCLLALSHCVAGILRGAGKTKIPMIVMLSSWCLLRITYISIIVRFIPVVNVIFWAYPLTWTVSSIAFVIYYYKADWIRQGSKAI